MLLEDFGFLLLSPLIFSFTFTSKCDNIILFLLEIEAHFTKPQPGSKTGLIENLRGEMI
jgi:hypothetical protein